MLQSLLIYFYYFYCVCSICFEVIKYLLNPNLLDKCKLCHIQYDFKYQKSFLYIFYKTYKYEHTTEQYGYKNSIVCRYLL